MKLDEQEKAMLGRVMDYPIKRSELERLYDHLKKQDQKIGAGIAQYGGDCVRGSSDFKHSKVEGQAINRVHLEDRIRRLDEELWLTERAASVLVNLEAGVIDLIMKGWKMSEIGREWHMNRRRIVALRNEAIRKMTVAAERFKDREDLGI